MLGLMHNSCSPATQYWHWEQVSFGLMTTLSLTLTRVTSDPTSTTSPAASPPSMWGWSRPSRVPLTPSLVNTSTRLTAQALTRILTSLGPMTGSGMSP